MYIVFSFVKECPKCDLVWGKLSSYHTWMNKLELTFDYLVSSMNAQNCFYVYLVGQRRIYY